jgi:cob(I)alamin adenosyltransferase
MTKYNSAPVTEGGLFPKMGNRLSKIATKTGDDGTTGLADGSRVEKTCRRVAAMGEVDELNSVLGLLLTNTLDASQQNLLAKVQHQLFDLGGELATPGACVLVERQVEFIEQSLEELNRELPPLKEFILPGGCPAAAVCHLARTVCRRAERAVVSLSQQESLNRFAAIYLNRLSDLLFVLARTLARREGGREVYWQPGKST